MPIAVFAFLDVEQIEHSGNFVSLLELERLLRPEVDQVQRWTVEGSDRIMRRVSVLLAKLKLRICLLRYADSHQVTSNIRFNFTHHPLSDLYVVYNDRRDSITGKPIERALILKLTNLFNF